MLAALFAAVASGAALHSATGFGFGLLAAPLLFAVLDPQPAVGLMATLGLVVNLMTILTERRRPHPLMREVMVLVAFALPGSLLGVAVLRSLDAVALQLLLSMGVIATLVVRHLALQGRGYVLVRPGGIRPRSTQATALAGLLAGVLTTSTSTSGPPLLLHLLGRGARPSVVRDTLTACFLALGLVTPTALLVTATTEAIPEGVHVAVLVPAAVLGHMAGRRAFAHLAHGGRYELAVTAVLLVSVVGGLLGVLL